MNARLVEIPGATPSWRVGDIEFVQSYAKESTATRFCLRKTPTLTAMYSQLCPEFHGGRFVELGIAAGGSTALLALLAAPVKLVACDIEPDGPAALDEFIVNHGLGDVVRPFYAVDQSDRQGLSAILDEEFHGEPLDVVIDDASHLYEQTVASFETLYPRLRVGGVYIIEDWCAQYCVAAELHASLSDPDSPAHATATARIVTALREQPESVARAPLAQMSVELLLASASSPDVIAEVLVNQHWTMVRRGPAPIDARAFRLSDLYFDCFDWLLSRRS